MNKENHLDGHYSAEDEREETLRPLFLEDFQGQKEIKENLSVFIQAARKRRESLDHVFISGPPGLGKTTLAGILSREMEGDFKVTAAPALEKPKDLAGILTALTPNCVFFIDEIHRLKPALEEMLYTAMEDFEIDWVIGQGPTARSIRIPLPKFTLIGATTKAGQVSSPLYSRFGIPIRINFYNHEDILRILHRSSKILNITITDKACCKLAQSSRGTPRVANRLLRRMRDFAQVEGNGTISEEIISFGLGRLGIDECGLEPYDREILRVIAENYGGGPVGAETLAISISEGVESLEDFYEPYLIQRGFLQRTPRGRIITDTAYSHLNLKKRETKLPDNEDQGILF